MAVTSNTFTGDGSTTNYSFTFEYLEQDEVKVTLDGAATTAFTFANATTLSFTSAPANGVEIRIYRDTNIDTLKATFFPGSAIKAEDLNNNFSQNNFAVQEIKANTWDTDTETIKSTETWVSSDAQIATTAAMDARFQDEATETIESTETWVSDDDRVPTTAAADARFVDVVNNETVAGVKTFSSSPIVPAPTSSTEAANKTYVDTLIDSSIDQAITNDIGVDSTGLTVTDDGDGTITMGIGSNSVDLDRIKNSQIITYAEQDAGSPAPADTNIFTASAAARRFDTIVQTTTPSGSDWEVGKTWLQNNPDKTLSVWDGSNWEGVASGGTFINQAKVVYVDATNGDDANDGHRISRPKATIKAAINQINAEINTSITNGGSGYADGTYSTVALTGGTGTGLTADITVASGVVTTVTINSSSTLEDYSIGDVLSAADADLGAGGGSGLEITVGGDGDGQVVVVSPGTYQEVAPIQIKRRSVSVIGQALRSCIVHPTVATENNVLFELNSGSYIAQLTLTGMQAGTGTGNTVDAELPTVQGWNFAFYNNAYIIKSPYIQNCTNFSDSEIDNSDLRAHRPRGGAAGDTDSAPTGGGLLVDGSAVASNSPLRSMVCDSYTHVGLNGPGILVTNNGYCQATSSYSFFNKYHIKCLNGGQANLAASTTDFGDYSLIADGKSTTAIFTSNVDGAAADQDITFNINEPTADASWHGSTTRPQDNMLVEVNGVIYPVVSATANTDSEGGAGWTVTITRPDPADRSGNLGLNGAVSDDAAVSFYLRSMIASSGHTMEYVGSGTNYSALPENGGVPIESRQITERNNGKIWSAVTDHKGKFSLGSFFTVDQNTGVITMETGSIQLDLGTLLVSGTGYAVLGAPLDMDGNEISNESGDLQLNSSTGNIDVQTNKIVNVGTPAASTDAATKGYVDTATAGIVTTSDIGVTVQAYDADTAKYDDTTANFTGTLQNGGSNVVVDSDIGVTVQAYDFYTAKFNTPLFTFTGSGTFSNNIAFGGNVILKGDSVDPGILTFNCEDNVHSVYIKGPSHSAAANYTLTLPDTAGNATEVLQTDGAGNLSWASSSGISAGKAIAFAMIFG